MFILAFTLFVCVCVFLFVFVCLFLQNAKISKVTRICLLYIQLK